MNKNSIFKIVTIILLITFIILFFIFIQKYQENKNNEIIQKYEEANNQINNLKEIIKNKNKKIIELEENYSKYEDDTSLKLNSALLPPYISVYNQTIYTVFKSTSGEIIEWETPFENLNLNLKKGYLKREYIDENLIPLHISYSNYILDLYNEMANNQVNLCNSYQNYVNYYNGGDIGCNELKNNLEDEQSELKEYFENSLNSIEENGKEYLILDNDGNEIKVMDFRPFVDKNGFENVIKDLYHNINNDADFIYEIWNMVSQLTTYSSEIEETPKYPYETLLSGGGDCEDTSILVASLLKAVPKDWDIELVYIDSNNPTNPQIMNHVIVYVDTGIEKYFIETTSKTVMNPYDEIVGWYFEV